VAALPGIDIIRLDRGARAPHRRFTAVTGVQVRGAHLAWRKSAIAADLVVDAAGVVASAVGGSKTWASDPR